MGRGAWWATVHRVAELDTTDMTWHACTHELTANQKNHGFKVSSSLILHDNKPFLDWIVMFDKKWTVYEYQR
ncbi:hypothetical protein G4228_017200 [Cervus hanglu yarkandensis]|nr:hypothetical protein G4228_017200 [Cervus hanglu yarkandensis]